MIKRIGILFLSVICLMLSGCNDYVEPEKRIVVSAVGIQKTADDFEVICETAAVPENSNDEEYTSRLYIGAGKTIDEAVLDVAHQISGKLSFYHCPVLLIGDGVINDALDFAVDNREISLSALVVAADNPIEILSDNNDGKILVGFKISELLKLENKNVTAAQALNSQSIQIPIIITENNSIEIK